MRLQAQHELDHANLSYQQHSTGIVIQRVCMAVQRVTCKSKLHLQYSLATGMVDFGGHFTARADGPRRTHDGAIAHDLRLEGLARQVLCEEVIGVEQHA
jgi:hypothetical protein